MSNTYSSKIQHYTKQKDKLTELTSKRLKGIKSHVIYLRTNIFNLENNKIQIYILGRVKTITYEQTFIKYYEP